MNQHIKQSSDFMWSHFDRLIQSAERSLNNIKSEPTIELKQVELHTLQQKIVKVEQYLESMTKTKMEGSY